MVGLKNYNMSTFPKYIFDQEHKSNVLDLFCAHFGGSNTFINFINEVDEYIGVDNNHEKILELEKKYPDLDFVCTDVYDLIDGIKEKSFEIVVSDQWTNQNDKLYSVISKLFRIATKYVVISTNEEYHTKLPAKLDDFALECFWYRSEYLGGTYWAIYKRLW